MSVVKLSTASSDAIGAWSGQSVKTDKIKVKVVDSLHADGVTPAMLLSPKDGADPAFFGSVKAAVVAGFTSNVQTLLDKDTKTLSDSQKTDKRYWQQQIGSKIKDLRNALVKREAQGEDGEARGNVASFEARLKRDLTKYIAQIEKGEAFGFPVAEMLKHLRNASVLIK